RNEARFIRWFGRNMLEQFSWNFRNGLRLNLPVKNLRAFGLNLDLATPQPHFAFVVLVTRVCEDEYDLAIQQVQADVAPRDHLADIPVGRLFRVQRRRDALAGGERWRAGFP